MPKRVLREIRLDKIAAVDKPCQQHATVAIIKRAPDADAPRALAKATFAEALAGQLLGDRVRDVFYSAFDNQYEMNAAFRQALIDELAGGGDGATATADYVNAVGQVAEAAAGAARAIGATATTEQLQDAVAKAATEWANQQEQTMTITTKAALQAAISKFSVATSTVGDMQAIKKAATDLGATDLLPVEGPLAPDTGTGEIATLKRRVDVAEMPANVRKHFDGLDAAAQTAFLAKSATERAGDVDAIEKGDPVLYKCKDGTEIRKSHGDVAVMLAKRADTQDETIASLRADTTANGMEKRAAAYPNIAKGTVIDLLKSIDQVGADTDAGKSITKSLQAMNSAGTGLFKRLGDAGGDDAPADLAKARSTYDGKVQEIKKRDSIGLADAMSKARVEHPDLYAAAYADEEAEA